jgi:hypothetical protein
MQFTGLLVLCLFFLTGSTAVQAQDRDNRGYGHREYRGDDRGRHEGQKYYRRAPWGLHRPLILSHDHGRVYYYGGHYYEYYPERGYLMIDIAPGYVFDEVPSGFRRVWIDGRWCYRRGDLYLRPGIHGYIAFPGPAGIRIGAGF